MQRKHDNIQVPVNNKCFIMYMRHLYKERCVSRPCMHSYPSVTCSLRTNERTNKQTNTM